MAMKALVLACAILAGNASASVLIDFTGVGDGAQVNDYYNGGTDSMGNSGVNYGIHFSGGTVAYNQFGAYIKGGASMSFAASTAGAGISVLMRGVDDDANSSMYVNGVFFEPVLTPAFDNPNCAGITYEACVAKGYGAFAYPESTLFPLIFPTGNLVNSIDFNTRALDNLIFGSTTLQPRRDGTVPEPGSIALLGLGVLGLIGARRRKSAKSKNV